MAIAFDLFTIVDVCGSSLSLPTSFIITWIVGFYLICIFLVNSPVKVARLVASFPRRAFPYKARRWNDRNRFCMINCGYIDPKREAKGRHEITSTAMDNTGNKSSRVISYGVTGVDTPPPPPSTAEK
jgi:hypothetical protein